jgi:predicted nucleotidyltransferase
VLTLLYRNDNGSLVNVPTTLPATYLGSLAWGDYDNDGDLDVLIAGANATGFASYAHIYRNDGNGVFADINAGLPAIDLGNAAWGDYDNDGDLDIALVGNGGDHYAKIFRNDNGTFTDINAPLTGVLWAWASWGDYDNDGDLDLAILGYNGNLPETRVYRNDAGTFTNSGATLEAMYLGQNSWADFNNDGKLELLLVGQRDVNLGTAAWLYRNLSPSTNTLPLAPAGLTVTLQGANALLNWQPASDGQTPTAGLAYNVRLGTNSGGGQIVSAQSRALDGRRLVTERGNAQLRTNLLVKGLVPGRTYYWSVQSVDTAFAGSAFATETSFTAPLAAAPGSLTITMQTSGFALTSSGTAGFNYGLEVATNLAATPIFWSRLATIPADEQGEFQFLDTTTNLTQRFYRVVFP